MWETLKKKSLVYRYIPPWHLLQTRLPQASCSQLREHSATSRRTRWANGTTRPTTTAAAAAAGVDRPIGATTICRLYHSLQFSRLWQGSSPARRRVRVVRIGRARTKRPRWSCTSPSPVRFLRERVACGMYAVPGGIGDARALYWYRTWTRNMYEGMYSPVWSFTQNTPGVLVRLYRWKKVL